MKHAALFCAGVAAAVLLASCATAGGYAPGAQTAPKAYAAGFADAANGVTVGYGGLVLRSADGGKNWEKGTNRSMCLFALENLGCGSWIAAGNQGNVTFTVDGGSSWSRLTSVPPARVTSLSFTSPAHGWASTRGWIGETVDGGQSWTALAFPEGMPPAETVSATGTGTGFFVGSDGYLYGTTDGGNTWTEPTMQRLKTPLASVFISPDFFISGLALDTSALRIGSPE